MQKAMFEGPDPVYRGEELLQITHGLIKKARKAKIPIIYIQHNGRIGGPLEKGTEGWKIHEQIKPIEGDIVIQKSKPDSFLDTGLHNILDERGLTTLIITGIQSDVCVDTTCRRACSIGYSVILVENGHSTWGTEELTAEQIISHENYILGNWFADLKTADEVEFS
ncbi:MAG: cysteine hydrolase [Firmicutes bacterium]|nr:cysteine hydrolase [Bacillota bacterium]